MNAKADTPKSAYPLNKQYKKYCIRCIPTLALSKSGYGSRPLSLLSACCRQAPHLFSCQVSQNNSCKTYSQLLSDVSSQTLSLTDDIIALHFFNCNISFRIFRIVLEWCYIKQITAWGFQVERTWDLVRDSGQRKLTYSSQNHCTSSRSVYLSRRLNSHWERFVVTHHLQKWESQLRLRWNNQPFTRRTACHTCI